MNSLVDNYFGIWVPYTIVFPLGIFIGLYRQKIFSLFSAFYGFSSFLFVCSILALIFYNLSENPAFAMVSVPHIMKIFVCMQYPICLIISIFMLGFLLDITGIKSGLLSILGNYSFEIYLLHFPFMVYYDFFLFRKPLVIYFIVYSLFIFLLCLFLRRITIILNKKVFPGIVDRQKPTLQPSERQGHS